MQRCLDPSERLAAADADRPLPAAWRDHLGACAACAGAVAAARTVAATLAALGRVERDAASADSQRTWTAVARALERSPGLARRLPIGYAGALSLARDLARPALAASVVALACGVALGAWLAVTTTRGFESSFGSDVSDDSNLAAAADGGFESGWLGAAAVEPASSGAGAAPAIRDDTTAADARSEP